MTIREYGWGFWTPLPPHLKGLEPKDKMKVEFNVSTFKQPLRDPNGTLITTRDVVEIEVKNKETGKSDFFQVRFTEEGTTYTLLLQKQVQDKMTGVYNLRELVETIGDDA